MEELFGREDFQNLARDAQNAIAVHLENKGLIKKVVEEGEEMCKAMRDWRLELLKEGREEGREEGKEEERELIISCLTRMKQGANYEELVAEGYSESLVKDLLEVQ